MDEQSVSGRTASSTVAVGTATLFILVATAIGLAPEHIVTPDTAPLHLRGTLAPEGAGAWQGPSLARNHLDPMGAVALERTVS